jgi:hypothetical protein
MWREGYFSVLDSGLISLLEHLFMGSF